MLMNVKEVREAIFELTSYYFQGASVLFGNQSYRTKQKNGKPLVIILTGSVTRPAFPPVRTIDGFPVSFYPCSVTVQIDLYTMGEKKEVPDGYAAVMENTAVDDMAAFLDFLGSEMAVQYCRGKDISIIVPDSVQDLTGLVSDTSCEYRARIELTVNYTSIAVGYSGMLSPDSIKGETVLPDVDTTPSGGGNSDVLSHEGAYFTNVKINDKPVKGERGK